MKKMFILLLWGAISVLPSMAGGRDSTRLVLAVKSPGDAGTELAYRLLHEFIMRTTDSRVSVRRVDVPAGASVNLAALAAEHNAGIASLLVTDDDEYYLSAWDADAGKPIVDDGESSVEVDIAGDKVLYGFAERDIYQYLIFPLMQKNAFFVSANDRTTDPASLIISEVMTDDDTKAAFPGFQHDLDRAFESAQDGSFEVRNVKTPQLKYVAPFMNSPNRLPAIYEASGVRWVLYGTFFTSRDTYQLNLFLVDAKTGIPAPVYAGDIPDAASLKRALPDIRAASTLVAGPATDYRMYENRRLCLVRDLRPLNAQMHVYSAALGADGSLVVSGGGGVASFSHDGRRVNNPLTDAYNRDTALAYRVRSSGKAIFCLDNATGRITRLSPDAPVQEFGSGLSYPMHLAVADGDVFTCSTVNNTMVKISPPYTTPVDVPHGLTRLAGIGSAPGGVLAWGSDHTGAFLTVVIDRSGTVRSRSTVRIPGFLPTLAAADAAGNRYLASATSGAIVKCDPSGRIIWITSRFNGLPAPLSMIMDIDVSDDGKSMIVADMGNKRALLFKELPAFERRAGADEYLALARKQDAAGDLYIALLRVAAAGPFSVDAAVELARYHRARGEYDLAVALWRQITAKAGGGKWDEERRRDEVRHLELAGDESARIALRVLNVSGPESARARYAEGVRNYEQALKIAPSETGIASKLTSLKAAFGSATGEGGAVQLEITESAIDPVFAAMYKFYSDNPFGSVTVRNVSGAKIDSFVASVDVKGYMDYPTETRIYRNLDAGAEQKIKLFAVFSNRLLELTEDTPQSAQITVRYTVKGREFTAVKTAQFPIHSRNALIWDDGRKISSFITQKDPVVGAFSREVLNRFRTSRFSFLNPSLLSAFQIFNTLGVYGVTYVKDPKTPFATFSRSRAQIDYIQYPRDTLKYKTGDCDDLTVLFCALLENIGIETATVAVPGHIFMMFNTGIPDSRAADISSNPALTVLRNGTVWIPLETTLLGKGMVAAWDEAARTWARYQPTNEAVVMPVHSGWETYAPVTLDGAWDPALPEKDYTERHYFQDIDAHISRELGRKTAVLEGRIKAAPGDVKLRNSLGLVHARFGKLDEAMRIFTECSVMKPDYFPAWQNMGNVSLLKGDLASAEKHYRKAQSINPKSAEIYINLAILYDRLNRVAELEQAYRAAIAIDKRYERDYAYLVSKGDTKAGVADHTPVWSDPGARND